MATEIDSKKASINLLLSNELMAIALINGIEINRIITSHASLKAISDDNDSNTTLFFSICA